MNKIITIVACFLLFGCRTTSPVETIADGAKETISDTYQALPKECQSKQTKVAFDSAIKQVESVKANCIAQTQILEEKIKHRNLLIVGLTLLVLALFYRKARSCLSRII